jgi:hypothetical protein
MSSFSGVMSRASSAMASNSAPFEDAGGPWSIGFWRFTGSTRGDGAAASNPRLASRGSRAARRGSRFREAAGSCVGGGPRIDEAVCGAPRMEEDA